jgi:hypothetical protein
VAMYVKLILSVIIWRFFFRGIATFDFILTEIKTHSKLVILITTILQFHPFFIIHRNSLEKPKKLWRSLKIDHISRDHIKQLPLYSQNVCKYKSEICFKEYSFTTSIISMSVNSPPPQKKKKIINKCFCYWGGSNLI